VSARRSSADARHLAAHLGQRCTLSSLAALIAIAGLVVTARPLFAQPVPPGPIAERVEFASADGKTTLVGYVFQPATHPDARVPAVVMMHGRAGAYSTAAHGVYDATTVSQRHQFWGRWWAQQGYLAVLVDGFGPRGYPQGFPVHSYRWRPAELNEVTIRPLDAYGALRYLRSRADVRGDRIGLQGWSNGGSATLASMAIDAPGLDEHTQAAGFRAALAFYPACRLKGHFDDIDYAAYAPLRLFMGTADEEVSPRLCRELLEDADGDIESKFYKGATHDFDDPGRRRQRIEANADAREDVIRRATRFFARQLGSSQ
jgi:carboxymethylenebutenolidase